jgi:hypothetical protein
VAVPLLFDAVMKRPLSPARAVSPVAPKLSATSRTGEEPRQLADSEGAHFEESRRGAVERSYEEPARFFLDRKELGKLGRAIHNHPAVMHSRHLNHDKELPGTAGEDGHSRDSWKTSGVFHRLEDPAEVSLDRPAKYRLQSRDSGRGLRDGRLQLGAILLPDPVTQLESEITRYDVMRSRLDPGQMTNRVDDPHLRA